MKDVDPKLVSGALIAVIVVCLVFVLKMIGVGANNTPPPLATGGMAAGASMSLPSAPPGTTVGGTAVSAAPNAGVGGSMVLPTPPPSR